ncbi:cell division protein FtsK [Sporosarcina sp. FSL W7-1349]|uniref:cell division protein FtsK n=1 Tax=Sporosarcina sp. FSL W7-1349 TaxID=2921561 RepID=UPI0030F63431
MSKRNRNGLSDEELEYIDSLPKQNPYGLVAMVLGGLSFIFGPVYGFIPIISILFCLLSYRTFDKEKEDNPWTFYIGLMLSIIGLVMFIRGEVHQLIV